MRVAPRTPGKTVAVASGDVHAAQIAHLSVDDDHLAVVAEIGVGRKEGEGQGDERFDLDACLLEFAVESAAGKVRQVVILHAHDDAFLHFLLEYFRHTLARLVILELEEFEMDVVACPLQVADQVVEHRVESQIGPERVAADRTGLIHLVHQGDEALIRLRHIGGMSGLRRVGKLLQSSAFFPGNEPSATGTMADQEIQHQPRDRQENDDQDPGQGVDGVLVFGDDVDDDPDQRQGQQDG